MAICKALEGKQEILALVGVPSGQVAVHAGGIRYYRTSQNLRLQRWRPCPFVVFPHICASVWANALPFTLVFLRANDTRPLRSKLKPASTPSLFYETNRWQFLSLPRRWHRSVHVAHQRKPKPLDHGGQLTGRHEPRDFQV